MKQIAQGAEAIIYRKGDVIVKHRFSKQYRHPDLDRSLRRFRTRREAKVITRLNERGISCPQFISVDDKEMKLSMSFVNGSLLGSVLEQDPAGFGVKLGTLIGTLHAADIIHGDITTSNVIDVNGNLHFIDFGLSSFSLKVEDKSVELQLLHRALESKHPTVSTVVFEHVVQSYLACYADGTLVIDRLDNKVSKRGRNKQK